MRKQTRNFSCMCPMQFEICVRTVDTDVVVVAFAMFRRIDRGKHWLSFGTGSNLQHIPIHDVAIEMNQQVYATLACLNRV